MPAPRRPPAPHTRVPVPAGPRSRLSLPCGAGRAPLTRVPVPAEPRSHVSPSGEAAPRCGERSRPSPVLYLKAPSRFAGLTEGSGSAAPRGLCGVDDVWPHCFSPHIKLVVVPAPLPFFPCHISPCKQPANLEDLGWRPDSRIIQTFFLQESRFQKHRCSHMEVQSYKSLLFTGSWFFEVL